MKLTAGGGKISGAFPERSCGSVCNGGKDIFIVYGHE